MTVIFEIESSFRFKPPKLKISYNSDAKNSTKNAFTPPFKPPLD